ncbi:MAG: hypothetical protein FWH00_03890, partial [Oscillospiraceae bacterium]|nr:hypothetical protein [Oscillospiraceae bacterium]
MSYIFRLFKLAKPWYGYLVCATLALFASAGVNLYTPIVIGRIIAMMETGMYAEAMNVVVGLALLLLGLFAARALFQFLTNYLSHV